MARLTPVVVSLAVASLLSAVRATAGCPDFGTGPTLNAGTLPISVAAGDFNRDGKRDLVVANESTNNVSVFIGNGNGTFAAKADFPAGNGPSAVAVGDFNRDGKLDIVVSNYLSHTVSILIGNGLGAFAPPALYAVGGSSPFAVVVADFNGDGKLDLATANHGSNNVAVLIGFGDGSFAPSGAFPAGSEPYALAAGDFNGDGKTDLAVANAGSNTVSILIGIGTASFLPKTDFSVGVAPYSVAIGDLNRDGKSDLVTANFGEGTVTVLLGNGSGGFPTSSDYSTGSATFSASIGDFNGDGRPDVAATDAGTNVVIVRAGNGNGTLAASTQYVVGSYPTTIAVGDYNRDGKNDLAVVNFLGGTVSILTGGGGTVNGVFATAVDQTNTINEDVAVADFNRDGKPDLAMVGEAYSGSSSAPSGVSIFIGLGDGAFAAPTKVLLPAQSNCHIAVGDFDGDGKTDIVTTDGFDNFLYVIHGDGNGSFSAYVPYPAGIEPQNVVVADFNGDGRPDIAVSNYNTQNISILLNTVNGFTQPAFFNVGINPGPLVAGDFNRDGSVDLAVTNYSSNNFSILLNKNDGTGAMFAPANYAVGASPTAIAAGDFDGDGFTDLVIARGTLNDVDVFLGLVNGVFVPLTTVAVGNYPRALSVGDFNEDGHADIAAANYYLLNGPPIDAALSLVFGGGNGTFAGAVNDHSGQRPVAMAMGDFNRDSKTDLVMVDLGFDQSIYLNRSMSLCIEGVTPLAGPTTGSSVVVSGTNLEYATSVTFGGQSGLVTSISINGVTTDALTVTTPAHAAGLVDVVVNADGGSDTLANGFRYVVQPDTPQSFSASATSAAAVALFWTAVSGADSYQIDRSASGQAFTQIDTSATNSYTDTTVSSDTAYLYRVRAATYGVASGNSSSDLATTVLLTSHVVAGGPTRARDFNEVRKAVNAVHILGNLGPVTFTDPVLDGTVFIKGVHITEMRDSLDAALASLGMPTFPYADTIGPGVPIRAAHLLQLWSRTQ